MEKETNMKEYTLPKGTVCKINGIPFALEQDTAISCHEGNWKLIQEDQRFFFSQSEALGSNPIHAARLEASITNSSSSESI